jgi:hypothetical protein
MSYTGQISLTASLNEQTVFRNLRFISPLPPLYLEVPYIFPQDWQRKRGNLVSQFEPMTCKTS